MENKKDLPWGSLLLSAYLVVYTVTVSTAFFKEYTRYYRGIVWWLIVALLGFFVLERYMPGGKSKVQRNERLKIGIVLVLCVLLIVIPTIHEIILFMDESCNCYVHDSLLQNELAVEAVMEGKNPYVVDYKGTILEAWQPVAFKGIENPAIYHYTYLPMTFLLPLPFQAVFENVFGWFDQRIVLLAAYLATLAFCLGFRISASRKAVLLIALGLNPFLSFLMVFGYNDILVLFWILLCVYALRFERPYLSAIALALACASKQYAFFFTPFYFFYLGGNGSFKERLRSAWRPILLFSLVSAAFILPWLIDNPSAFIQDVLGYHSGVVLNSYPINGISFTSILLMLGVIKSITDTFPSYIIQLVFVVPLTIILLWIQRRDNTLRRAFFNYSILMAVVIFFARAGNMNHWGYFFALFALGMLLREPQEVPAPKEELALGRVRKKSKKPVITRS
jgi:Gpi18-like mannosyltransferase